MSESGVSCFSEGKGQHDGTTGTILLPLPAVLFTVGLVFQDPKKEGECFYLIRLDLIFIQIYFMEFLVNLPINLIFFKSDSKYLCTIFCIYK